MNRIISLSVEDMYIKYTGEAFGATGSHNAVTLRMTFGPAWEGTAKTAYFTDALGNASVALVLGLDTLVDGAYEVDVPSEALKTAGVATITIKGVLVSGETTTKAITTAAGHFRVLDSELPDSAGNAGIITPSDKDQLQAEIAGMETLFTTAKAAAEAAAANAKVSETNAKASETAAASSASSAEASKTAAAESADTATEQASAASKSATSAAASQKAASTSESAAKASETAAKAAQTGAETAESNAKASAAAAAGDAQTSQTAANTATGAASTASTAAEAASGSASQASAAATAAAGSAVGAEAASKTAQSWAVGGTNTRPGEDTDNAKYWANQAEAVVGGDFATKVEAQGYVTAHNQSNSAHSDIRKALNGKEASGTAAAAVTAHNKDSTAHADIREALAGKEAAGAAAAVQSNLTAHAGNTTVHVTSEEKTAWNGSVRYDAAQSLTDAQKTQARDNIGAANKETQDKVMATTSPARTVTLAPSDVGAYLKALPRMLTEALTIKVTAGTVPETLRFSGFYGPGNIYLTTASGGKDVTLANGVSSAYSCAVIGISNMKITGGTSYEKAAVINTWSSPMVVNNCDLTAGEPAVYGIYSNGGSLVTARDCSISGYTHAVMAQNGAKAVLNNITASGNTYGGYVWGGGTILLCGSTPETLGGSTNNKSGGMIVKKDGTLL